MGTESNYINDYKISYKYEHNSTVSMTCWYILNTAQFNAQLQQIRHIPTADQTS